MSGNGQELEVKFLVSDLAAIEGRLKALGAALAQPRVYESNLRFDRPNGELSSARQALRLRMDSEARLTFKGPGREQDGVQQRQELEFTVSDYQMARQFLEALGFQVIFMYEKYRTTYRMDNVLVTLDEMPFGQFIEIEGPDGESILQAAQKLGVTWERRVFENYTGLFERVKNNLGLSLRDLSFDNFKGINVNPKDLGAEPADQDQVFRQK